MNKDFKKCSIQNRLSICQFRNFQRYSVILVLIACLPLESLNAQKLGKYLSCGTHAGTTGIDILGGSSQNPAISGPDTGTSGSLRFSLYATSNLSSFKQGAKNAFLIGQEQFEVIKSDQIYKKLELYFAMQSGANPGYYYFVAILEEYTKSGWQFSSGVYWSNEHYYWTGKTWKESNRVMFTTNLF